MSDSSDSSTASDTSINDISDEEFYGYDHNDQEEWSDFADAADDDPMHEDDPQMENISRLVLCSKPKQDLKVYWIRSWEMIDLYPYLEILWT